jgi:hypothetical protein
MEKARVVPFREAVRALPQGVGSTENTTLSREAEQELNRGWAGWLVESLDACQSVGIGGLRRQEPEVTPPLPR